MIQTMMINEIKKHIEGDDASEDEFEETVPRMIFAPIQIIYESGSDDDN